MACHCDDFSKAQAGRGLRGIEPGMPTPAGTGLSRRAFLARSSGLALSVFGGVALSRLALEEGIAAAQSGSPSPVLVSIFLSGGLDSLSVLAPIGDPRYASLRPDLRLTPSGNTADVFTEDDRLHWHPSAAPLRDLHRAGKVSVMPAIGYTGANQSHFTSRHYWEVGEVNPFGRIGWLGRYLDKHGVDDNPLQGLSLDYNLAPALAAADRPVAAVASPEYFSLGARDVWDATIRTRMVEALSAAGPPDDRRQRAPLGPPRGGADGRAARPAHAAAGHRRAVADRGPVSERGRLRPPAGGARGDARPRPAAEGRRARRQRRLRHARRPERLAARRPRGVLAARSRPSRPTSRRAASPTAC